MLDWTAARIAHPAYDLAFTRLLLANPPLHAPRPLRPVINAAARRMAKRILTTYTKVSPHPIDADTLACMMPADVSLDIDTELDLITVEAIMKRKQHDINPAPRAR